MEDVFRNWYDKRMKDPQHVEESEQARCILASITQIAIVGISKEVHKDSHYVGRYLKRAGYRIFPVNPSATTILGETAYTGLQNISERVDVISIFRKTSDLPAVIQEALPLKPKAIWIQLGIEPHPEAVNRARQAGIQVYTHRCIKVDHQFLIRTHFTKPGGNSYERP